MNTLLDYGAKMSFGNYFKNKRVLVTGDTGFKGSWLSLWLNMLGADVYGLALEPSTNPSNFQILQLDKKIKHQTVDIRNADLLTEVVAMIRPEVVFHLAAQPIVRLSYEMPVETLQTNFIGTANLLQSIRQLDCSPDNPCTVVVVTSDKCYENKEIFHGYREGDPMGGYDIYSMSKGAAELLVASWRRSFFNPADWANHGVSLATVRAGNVIGGGDWSKDRIVVDCMNALAKGQPVGVRNPKAVRPWQHLLEPLSGYMQLAAEMGVARGKRPELLSAYNFGPGRESECTVKELVETALKYWQGGSWEHLNEHNAVHEANYLKLSTDKAWHLLQWQPVWKFKECIQRTVAWYKTAYECNYDNKTLINLSVSQIEYYTAAARNKSLRWPRESLT